MKQHSITFDSFLVCKYQSILVNNKERKKERKERGESKPGCVTSIAITRMPYFPARRNTQGKHSCPRP